MSQAALYWSSERFIAVALLLLLPPTPTKGGDLQLWQPVMVSYSRMTMYDTMQQEIPFLPPGVTAGLYCASTCLRLGWCKVWCSHPSTIPTHCIVSNTIIMPEYNELNMDDAITCQTTYPQDKATNAIISAGSQAPWFPNKVKENLVDGIFSYNNDEYYSSATSMNENWILLDFTQAVTFTRVVLYAPNNPYADKTFYDLEVRVGNTTVTPKAGLAAYDLFGEFHAKSTPGQVVELKKPTPVSARFLSVEKITDDPFEFEIAHIEVY